MKKKAIWILKGMVVVIVTALILGKKTGNSEPPVLVKNFVDLRKIEKISKFRSCQGHLVIPVDGNEPKSNMKHYFWLKPEYQNTKKVKLFAPYTGKISETRAEPNEGLEGEIWISNGNSWQFSIEHIQILSSLKKGEKVEAGQLLGYAAGDDFDIVYAKGALIQKKIDGWNSPFAALDSVFNHMSDELLTEYRNNGVNAPKGMIYKRSFREANPCVYRDKKGGFESGDLLEDWVYLK